MTRRAHLFRWHRHWQLDTPTRNGWLSIGLSWESRLQPIAYWSPDATPMHHLARGWGRG